MDEQQALSKMYSPQDRRPGKRHGGVMQIWITRACDKSCFGCTQGSNLAGRPSMISPEHFEQACLSVKDYWGTVGVFGGNPATHPEFPMLCKILAKHIPFEQRGLWCNNPLGHGAIMRHTFNPARSNLNVHLDRKAYEEFKRDWPESRPFGLDQDSRHSPPFVAMQDVITDEEERWNLISECDINKHWSAMICVVEGDLVGYFCEIAGAQAMLHENNDDWPQLGVPIEPDWWKYPMEAEQFASQARFHCHRCGVPLRGYGQLAQAEQGTEQSSRTHADVYKPKRKNRPVQLVTRLDQLYEDGNLSTVVDYLGNAKR